MGQSHEETPLDLTEALQNAGLNISPKFIKAVIAPQLVGVRPEDIENVEWQKGLKFAYINGVWQETSLGEYDNQEFIGLKMVGDATYQEVVDKLGERLGKKYTKLGERILVRLKGEPEPRSYFFASLFATHRGGQR